MRSIFKRTTRTPRTPTLGTPADRRAGGRASVDMFMNRFLDGHPYLCVAVDVSKTGMKLRPLSGPHSDARYMGLQFQLPGCPDVISASGERVRDVDGNVAIRFTHVSPSAQEALDRYLGAAA